MIDLSGDDQFLSDPLDGVVNTHVQAAFVGLEHLASALGATVQRRVRGLVSEAGSTGWPRGVSLIYGVMLVRTP